jgi:hypothetical protein
VPLRVGLIGRHSARGKKKDLVRGLQRLGGSWWRVSEIELILVGVRGSLLLCRRWTARYLHACIITSGVKQAIRLVFMVSWVPCFVGLTGVCRSALSSALTCRVKEGIKAPFTNPSGQTLREDYSRQTDHLHSHLGRYNFLHFRRTAGNNCCNSRVK